MTVKILKILLVDDDEDDYVMTRDLLDEVDKKRYQLDWLTDFDEALAVILRGEHDLYLLDYRLGAHTGLELLEEAIKGGCVDPIILLTGQGDQEVDMKAMEKGAVDFLVKGTIDASLLERSLRYALDRKRAEKQILRLAYYDNLTRLPNRSLFKERLQEAIAQAEGFQKNIAILFIDLDNFKRINDTLGHSGGDLLLKQVAEHFLHCVRSNDVVARLSLEDPKTTVARLGGDEFTILLTEIKNMEDAGLVAQRILEVLSAPLTLNDQEVSISTSIGIALYPYDGKDIDTLLKNADTAMYHAKAQGKNNYQYYEESLNVSALERLTFENSLRKALKKEEFLLYYQPQIETNSGKIVGLEVLLRWKHPRRGVLPPAEFIPLAESSGLITAIGEWVLDAACAQNRAWQNRGLVPLPLSVNISALQFKQRNFTKIITAVLNDSGLAPEHLILEITEGILMQNSEETIFTVHELRDMGIRLSMDDFGIGYSSLSYLKRFPLYSVKIDRSFIRGVAANFDDCAIVKAIIGMAHSLRLRVVAEGVETRQQLEFLHEQQCDMIQGYLVSRPLPGEEIVKFLDPGNETPSPGQLLCRKWNDSSMKKSRGCHGQ